MAHKVYITNQQKTVKVPSGLRILIRRSCNAVGVASAARSLPASGSLNSWHQISSARKIGLRKRCFCQSEPASKMVGAAQPTPIALTAPAVRPTPAWRNSSSMIS